MAEKEERIYIEYFKDDPCKNCDVAEVGYCVDEDKGHGCLDKSNYIYGIPRQEAIERMAKVRYAQSPCYDARGNKVSFEDFREDYKPCYEDLIKEVEPLLNALLEGKSL